jgi:hypothetical protein
MRLSWIREDPPGAKRIFQMVDFSAVEDLAERVAEFCNAGMLELFGDDVVIFTSVRWFVKKSGCYFKIDEEKSARNFVAMNLSQSISQ